MQGRKYIYEIIDEKDESVVARVTVIEAFYNEKATMEVIDEEHLPIDLKISDRSSESILICMKDRVLPSNRMFLAEDLKRIGIQPGDWKSMILLNKGRTYQDNYRVELISNETINTRIYV